LQLKFGVAGHFGHHIFFADNRFHAQPPFELIITCLFKAKGPLLAALCRGTVLYLKLGVRRLGA
jgi:hypothetical protein